MVSLNNQDYCNTAEIFVNKIHQFWHTIKHIKAKMTSRVKQVTHYLRSVDPECHAPGRNETHITVTAS